MPNQMPDEIKKMQADEAEILKKIEMSPLGKFQEIKVDDLRK